MTGVELIERCQAHGYRSLPTSEQAMRDAIDIEKEGINVDRLVEFAAILETREQHPCMGKL